MTLAEKLTEVANNRPKLYNKGALDYSPQETVSGEAIGIKDISPIEHNMGVSVRNTNLINEKAVAPISVNAQGVKRYGWDLGVLPQGNYALTAYGNYIKSKTVSYKIITNGVYGDYISLDENTKTKTITLNGSQGLIVYLYEGVTDLYDNVTLMLNEGATSLPYAPYIEDISKVKLYKQGKNLIQPKAVGVYKFADTLDTFEILEDGGVYFESATNNTTTVVNASPFTNFTIQKSGVYAFSQKGNVSGMQSVVDVIRNGTHTYYYGNNTMSLQIGDVIRIYVQLAKGATITNVLMYCWIEFNSATEYEPYIEPTVYDVQADGTVEGVKSLYPSTSLYTDTSGAVIDCTYYQDGKKVKENLTDIILSLGGVINE